MPLDNTGKFIDAPSISADPLARLGITPVPDDFVSDFKIRYRENWLRKNDYGAGKPGPFEWQTLTYALWAKAANPRMTRKPLTLTLEKFLLSRFWNEDSSPAPKPLIALATTVQEAIPGAQFSVDYFYTDPVLNVRYLVGDEFRTVCLGIWDHGEIKAIAAHPEMISVLPQSGSLSWIIPPVSMAIMLLVTLLTWS